MSWLGSLMRLRYPFKSHSRHHISVSVLVISFAHEINVAHRKRRFFRGQTHLMLNLWINKCSRVEPVVLSVGGLDNGSKSIHVFWALWAVLLEGYLISLLRSSDSDIEASVTEKGVVEHDTSETLPTERQRTLQSRVAEIDRQPEESEAELGNMPNASLDLTRALITENTRLQRENQVLRDLSHSDWALGLTDVPPPSYPHNQTSSQKLEVLNIEMPETCLDRLKVMTHPDETAISASQISYHSLIILSDQRTKQTIDLKVEYLQRCQLTIWTALSMIGCGVTRWGTIYENEASENIFCTHYRPSSVVAMHHFTQN
ncbi:hypothetical protein C8J56DRAFT_1115607 [Mycena floridula]|nr:hypothetical protein C8J56DRAFT_1115607 [Mycena floridula]